MRWRSNTMIAAMICQSILQKMIYWDWNKRRDGGVESEGDVLGRRGLEVWKGGWGARVDGGQGEKSRATQHPQCILITPWAYTINSMLRCLSLSLRDLVCMPCAEEATPWLRQWSQVSPGPPTCVHYACTMRALLLRALCVHYACTMRALDSKGVH